MHAFRDLTAPNKMFKCAGTGLGHGLTQANIIKLFKTATYNNNWRRAPFTHPIRLELVP